MGPHGHAGENLVAALNLAYSQHTAPPGPHAGWGGFVRPPRLPRLTSQSEEPTVPWVTDDHPQDPQRKSTADASSDRLLSAIVGFVDLSPDNVMPVSLYTGGAVIVGDLISVQRYYERTQRFVAQRTGGEEGILGHLFQALVERETELREEEAESRDSRPPRPRFLHLADYRVLGLAGFHDSDDPNRLLRLRISSVDGWVATR